MEGSGNIVIGDESALHLLMHDDTAWRIKQSGFYGDPLAGCAHDSTGLEAFNCQHPLYGRAPVKLLVPARELRRKTSTIEARLASGAYPAPAFFQLRDGLFVAMPELVFLRMAERRSLVQVVVHGVDLCGRYYLRLPSNDVTERSAYLTSPERLNCFIGAADGLRGSKVARAALEFVAANSASPEETRSWVQFCLPARYGSFGLDFTHMNYDVRAGRLAKLTMQNAYSVDIANPTSKKGMEYDGGPYHQDASADKRRRNELKALGWDIFPLDASVLYNPDATIRFAGQVAKNMGRRLRLSATWERKFVQLRKDIGLPV